MNKESFEKILKDANEIKKIQGNDGNYNYDSYMLGLYNGMENIIAMFEKRNPNFIDGHNISFLKENKLKQSLNEIREYVNNTDTMVISGKVMQLKDETSGEHILQIIDKALGDDNVSKN